MPSLLTIELRLEPDVVLVRQRSRQIAGLLGFKPHEQTGIATAVSEIARNAFQYAGGGKVEFLVEGESPQIFNICIRDKGPGIENVQVILDGRYKSSTGLGLGIVGAKRLTDYFQIETAKGKGTTVALGSRLPKQTPPLKGEYLAQIVKELTLGKPESAYEEIQRQNQELMQALEELRIREEELIRRQALVEQLNRELEETNRGVVALYAELDEKAEDSQRSSKLKSHFLSDMSHEFRTPLNSIQSLSRLLLERADGDLTPEQEKQVTFIRKSAEILSELVNNLLDLSKIEAGKIVIKPTDFSVAELFSSLRGMFRPLINFETTALIFEEPIEISTLHTDEGKVSQILRNYISNAVKFTENGEIRIAAVKRGENTVIFSVSDTGIGIASEDRDRIFEEYIQVEGPIQQRVKGTGLGLPLCRKLAQVLGGSVSVKSEVGVGSTFLAAIPMVYSESTEELDAPEIPWILNESRSQVLVVEDNLDILSVYEKYLQKTTFQLIPARSLTQARQALQKIRPSAIILDVLLGGENAWSFISELKGNAPTRDIPVVVVTAIANRQKAIDLGADEFCVKPVEPGWLINQITTLLHRKLKILIVDDDPVARYLLRKLLCDRGYTIIEASSGGEGIRKVREEQPALIFLDLGLPDKSGVEVLDRLKSDPSTRNIPVIVNTSKNLDEEERQYIAGRTVAIISKESSCLDAAIAKIEEALIKIKKLKIKN